MWQRMERVIFCNYKVHEAQLTYFAAENFIAMGCLVVAEFLLTS